MWRRYFKLVKLVPGRVIVQGHGTIDFAGDVPVALCQQLYEEDFEFLEITEEGKRELYGIGTEPPTAEADPSLEGGELSPVVFNQEQVTSNEQPVKKPKRRNKRKV